MLDIFIASVAMDIKMIDSFDLGKENIKHYWCDSKWQQDNIQFLAPNNLDLADLLMAEQIE